MGKKELNDDALFKAMQHDLDKKLNKIVCKELQITNDTNTSKNKAIELECNKRKKNMITVINDSVRLQRLYFILRTILMGIVSALITFSIIFIIGTIDFYQALGLGIFVYIFSLMFSRLFDDKIVTISIKLTQFLEKHDKLRSIFLKLL